MSPNLDRGANRMYQSFDSNARSILDSGALEIELGRFPPSEVSFSPLPARLPAVATTDVAPVGAEAMPTAGRPADKEEEMSRRFLRTVLAGLALALVLALAAPAYAGDAGPRDRAPGLSFEDFIAQWVVGLLEKIGIQTDPNGSGGSATPSGTGNGDIGWQ